MEKGIGMARIREGNGKLKRESKTSFKNCFSHENKSGVHMKTLIHTNL
jgi:hypothetical protein